MINEIGICDYIKNRLETDDDILVDIREELMYEFGSLPGAVNIPIDDIRLLYRLPKDKTVYVFCQAGEISGEIAELLSDAGYTAYNLTGGYREYLRNNIGLKEES
ncbi:MAG: rhodanese-like domain-containing protein [Firmicutes bacterium]|nr:rhodanese-like domain-containing protein [Bacillota bacterium]